MSHVMTAHAANNPFAAGPAPTIRGSTEIGERRSMITDGSFKCADDRWIMMLGAKNVSLLHHFIVKPIVLPKQARDKHIGKALKKESPRRSLTATISHCSRPTTATKRRAATVAARSTPIATFYRRTRCGSWGRCASSSASCSQTPVRMRIRLLCYFVCTYAKSNICQDRLGTNIVKR